MALLLHIDTALAKATVGLSRDGNLLMELGNMIQQDHAAFVQPAIQQLLNRLNCSIADVDAIGVTSGPGSYTGLRVGMASAKGICYALGKPLLTLSTLEVMTAAAIEQYPEFDVYVPMIDARRNEVYTALYSSSLDLILPPRAIILSDDIFAEVPVNKKTLCFGSGAPKWEAMPVNRENTRFIEVDYTGTHLSHLFYKSFKNNDFCSLAYTEPLYAKAFHFEKGNKKTAP